ncbi:MAG: prepilin-type N-terminal cleavage/methylation domain-containing protein [Planctomycetota bacterium]
MQRKAFTLIELLVVISIIALLISILLPTLQSAREAAQASVCLQQVRQSGAGLLNYAQDYDGISPRTSWAERLLDGAYLADGNATVCPTWTPFTYETNGAGYGVRSAAFSNPTGGEQVNLVPGREDILEFMANFADSPLPRDSFWVQELWVMQELFTASAFPMLGDSARFNAVDDIGPQVRRLQTGVGGAGLRRELVHARHQGRANVWFLDGHAESLDLIELDEANVHQAILDGMRYNNTIAAP